MPIAPQRVTAPLLALALLAAPALAVPGQYNATADEGKLVCMYPLSGAYSGQWRFLFYLLLASSIALGCSKDPPVWLVGSSAAAAMAYSGLAAVHAVLLLAITQHSEGAVFDADIVAVFAVLGVAVLAIAPLLELPDCVRESRFRPALRGWGLTIIIGSACSLGGFLHHFPLSEPPPSCAGTGTPCDAAVTCADVPPQPLRPRAELTAAPAEMVFGTLSNVPWGAFGLLIVIGFLTTAMPLCAAGRRKTRAEIRREIEYLERLNANPPPRAHYRHRHGRQHGRHDDKADRKKRIAGLNTELRTGQYVPRATGGAYLNLCLCPLYVVLNEVYLLGRGGVPTRDPPFVVGQWGPWVIAAQMFIAVGLTRWYEPKWKERNDIIARDLLDLEAQRRQAPIAEARAQPALSQQVLATADIEPGSGRGVASTVATPAPAALKG